MDSRQVMAAIERIAATKGKKAKADLLRDCGRDETFLRVVRAALDPFVTYGFGTARLPKRSAGAAESRVFDHHTWELLEVLAKRGITGNTAYEALRQELDALDDASGELLRRILLKDLRAGFSADTVNKLFPDAVPSFKCMLAQPFEEKRITDWPVFVEPKLDGWRALAFVDFTSPTPTATFFTRSGEEIGIVEHLKKPLIDCLAGMYSGQAVMVDGEIVSGSFNETASSLQKKTEQAADAIYVAFDLVTKAEWDSADEDGYLPAPPYEERSELLGGLLWTVLPSQLPRARALGRQVLAMPRKPADSAGEIMNAYEHYRELGLEGAIVKPANGRYRKARDYAWMKIKAEETLDLKVVGAYPGDKGKQFENCLGGIIVKHGDVLVRVGGGLTPKQRAEWWEAWLRDQERQASCCDAECELVGRIAEIKYHEVTPDGSLRSPRFVRFREDKRA